jgi:hypothetical protein
VYLTDAVKKMISDEKKPHLYDKVRGDDKSEIVEAMKDALMITPSNYVRIENEQALKIVNMSFRIIYDDRFVIGIEHLQEQFQESRRKISAALYQELGLDIVLNSQFMILN